MTDGGLKALCDQADEKTAIIGTLPVFINLETGQKTIPQVLSKPKRWNSKDYLERLTEGWIRTWQSFYDSYSKRCI